MQFNNKKLNLWVSILCTLQCANTATSANVYPHLHRSNINRSAASTCFNGVSTTRCRSFLFAGGILAKIETPNSTAVDINDDERVNRWRLTLMYGALLLVIFITAAAAIIVFSRRWRQWIRGGRKSGPTDAADVWAMHREPSGDEGGPDDSDSMRDDMI